LSDDGTSTVEVRRECGVEKDALYWTAKYMSQAVASASATDPAWGLAGGLTPLAAVFAAKWRQQVIQDTGNEVWHGCYGTAVYCQGHFDTGHIIGGAFGCLLLAGALWYSEVSGAEGFGGMCHVTCCSHANTIWFGTVATVVSLHGA